MSFQALAWAAKAKCGRSSDKLILLAFADRHNEETGMAYPSIAWLCEFSGLDRKTVLTSVARLVDAGFLQDSGKRAGATKQVKVYLVNLETVPKTEQSQKRNSPVFPSKQSQKRDTEPVINQPLSSEAKASSVPPSRKATNRTEAMAFAEEVWSLQPITEGRRRSTRPDVVKALASALDRGGLPEEILAALKAYYAQPASRKEGGRYASGAVVLINADRWRDFIPKPPPSLLPASPDVLAQRERHFRDTGEWKPAWGERAEAA